MSTTNIMSRIMPASVSCFDTHDIWTWYRRGHDLGYEMTNIFTFTFISWYHYISISIMLYHGISWHILWYSVSCDISSIMWYRVISCDIMWYQACEARRPQRERFSNPVETFLTTWGEGWSLHLPHRPSCQPPCRKVPHTNPTRSHSERKFRCSRAERCVWSLCSG